MSVGLREKPLYSELFWSTFSSIRTEYGEILRRDTPYLSVFSPNVGKYGPRVTSNTDTFYTVQEARQASLPVNLKEAINFRLYCVGDKSVLGASEKNSCSE